MPIAHLYPGLMVLAALMLVGYAIGRRSSFFSTLVEPNAKARYAGLDGLRGFLAVGVLIHHGAITWMWLKTGHWTLVGFPGFELLGTLSVGLFFMITGFLFWGKMLHDGGVHVRNHIRGRIFRLAPMYLAVAACASVVTVASLWSVKIPVATSCKTAFTMLAMGIPPWYQPHGFDTGRIVAGVTWTLRYEWLFYAVLPLLVFIRNPKWLTAIVVGYMAYFFATTPHAFVKPFGPSINLLGGMVAAQVMHSGALTRFAWKSRAASVIGLLTITALPTIITRGTPLALFPLTLFVFLLVVNGNTFFGLLTMTGPKTVGTMSYSLYLLHGMVLYLAHPLLRSVMDSTPAYWLTVLGLGTLAIGVSAITYRLIEHPFIEMERARRKAAVPAAKLAPAHVWTNPVTAPRFAA